MTKKRQNAAKPKGNANTAVAASENNNAAAVPERKPHMSKWKLIQFYVVFVVICGGAFVLFDPTSLRVDSGSLQLLFGLLVLLLVLLLLLPEKPLKGSVYNRKVSRIQLHKARLAQSLQQKLDKVKKKQ